MLSERILIQCLVIVFCLSAIFATTAIAAEAELQQQIESLQQRVEQLETESGSGGEESRFSFGGLLSGAYQYQNLDAPYDDLNGDHGAVLLQPEVEIELSEHDKVSFTFRFAAGNSLNDVSPFLLKPWAAPLEDDVKNINGRNRDYLLTAWYAHTFELSADRSLELTGGIIDASEYFDDNAYAKNEYTQFMNEALVHAPDTFLPAFDLGGVAVLDIDQFEISVLGMNVAENEEGNGYNFYGAEVAYKLETSMGSGGYRVIAGYSTEAFLDPAELNEESQALLMFSFDQAFGKNFGAWTRFGIQSDKPQVDYARIISGGIDLKGTLWGRADDNIGIGYAFLDGGNKPNEDGFVTDTSQIFEAYYRIVMNEYFALTLDGQFLKDKYVAGTGPSGYVLGARGTVEF